MTRKLFCEWSPLTYRISVTKGIMLRRLQWLSGWNRYARKHDNEPLPIKIYTHKSLIRRRLGNVNMQLQENKAVNLSLAAPEVNGILIRPGEIFSFWKLVGNCTERKGFKEGLVIKGGEVSSGIAGGMCQFTNLIHWMVLHSPLDVLEHHHHNQIDMFPDYGRQIPFGTGTSIMYNYLDYQFINRTDQTFQLITYVTDEHLCGELRSDSVPDVKVLIKEEEHYFNKEADDYYRNNKVYKHTIDKRTGNLLKRELVVENHSRVLYDHAFVPKDQIREIGEDC